MCTNVNSQCETYFGGRPTGFFLISEITPLHCTYLCWYHKIARVYKLINRILIQNHTPNIFFKLSLIPTLSLPAISSWTILNWIDLQLLMISVINSSKHKSCHCLVWGFLGYLNHDLNCNKQSSAVCLSTFWQFWHTTGPWRINCNKAEAIAKVNIPHIQLITCWLQSANTFTSQNLC